MVQFVLQINPLSKPIQDESWGGFNLMAQFVLQINPLSKPIQDETTVEEAVSEMRPVY